VLWLQSVSERKRKAAEERRQLEEEMEDTKANLEVGTLHRPNNTKHECLLHLDFLGVFVFVVCLFLYGPFRHGALKLDISTLFTTFFL